LSRGDPEKRKGSSALKGVLPLADSPRFPKVRNGYRMAVSTRTIVLQNMPFTSTRTTFPSKAMSFGTQRVTPSCRISMQSSRFSGFPPSTRAALCAHQPEPMRVISMCPSPFHFRKLSRALPLSVRLNSSISVTSFPRSPGYYTPIAYSSQPLPRRTSCISFGGGQIRFRPEISSRQIGKSGNSIIQACRRGR